MKYYTVWLFFQYLTRRKSFSNLFFIVIWRPHCCFHRLTLSVCGFYAFFPTKIALCILFLYTCTEYRDFYYNSAEKSSGMHWSQGVLLLLLGLLLLFICWQVVQKEQLRRQLWMDHFKQYGYKMYPNTVFSESLCMIGFWSSYVRFQIHALALLQLFWISPLAWINLFLGCPVLFCSKRKCKENKSAVDKLVC